MAVNFKIPKSPKREIYDIDTFIGADLTNSGADMDLRRSPNAENMVRYVPGKVRKRTGYRKEVLFAPIANVNFAEGTSSEDQVIGIMQGETIPLYKLTRQFGSGSFSDELYVEFDYKSEYQFKIANNAAEPSEEWTHWSDTINLWTDDEYIEIYSWNTQTIHIKNFSAMLEKDESYKWSAAPKYLVQRTSIDPIYGCHIGKAGTFEGNKVVNVNRALSTHNYEQSFSVNTTNLTIYTLGEMPTPNSYLYVEFDYYITGQNVRWMVGDDYYHTMYAIGTWSHESVKLQASGYPTTGNQFKVWTANGTATLKIKNLSVMYDKNSSYEWSAAPEDNGGTFPVEDLYYIGTKNYALVDSADEDSVGTKWFTIAPNDSKLHGYSHISFTISTSSEQEITGVEIVFFEDDNPYFPNYTQYFSESVNRKKVEIFFNPGGIYYITKLRITVSLNDNTKKSRVTLNDIKVNTIGTRSSYDLSPINYLYHVGNEFFIRARNSDDFISVYSNANKHLSRSWQMKKNLIIIDGSNIYQYSIEQGTIDVIDTEIAYIPLLTIAKEPSGGGTSYESLNLLQPGFYEMFQGRAGVTQFQLTFGNLDPTECKAWVMNQSGGWELKTEETDFTVNRSTGKITFTTAPGVSPITGEDNVKILAYRTIEDYRERITKCTTGALYGVGGAGDRLFLTGNPDHPNWDFYSQQYDPTYFPDVNYATLGSEQSAITGYAIVNNYLATFKDGYDLSQSVFVREGDMLKQGDDENATSEPVFKLINTLQGEGVVSPYTFGYLQTEPLFLTKQGIYAITEQDITGEKYSQNRSFYLDGKLRKEPNLENAMATIYDDQYVLALNNQLYILDGLQATRTDKSEPYATRQYAGFYCTNVPALCIWQDDGVWFGTNDGRVCAFNTDIETLASYNDDGEPIYACWETPDLDGHLFYKNKTFRYFAVRLMQAIKTSAKLYSRKLGVWNFIREETVIGNPIDFENFDFEMFSFSQDTTEKVIHTKVRVKKVDKARFRVENGEYNQPFGLFDLALEYIESGNYKG